MPSDPPTSRDLDAFRDEADRFLAEMDEEFYLHFAGLKDTLELEPIYERHADLAALERAQTIGLVVDGDPRIRELWRFACEGYVGRVTSEFEEKIAAVEAELEVEVDGEKIGFRMLRPTMANEPDRGRRERLDGIRCDLTEEHFNPVYLDAARTAQRAVNELGAPTTLELYERFGFALDDLADQCRTLLSSTESLFEKAADRLFRSRLGLGLDEARRWDIARLFRAPEWDPAFTSDAMVPALESTLADLGIDLRAQENVHLDIEQRPNKTPRAFCAAIEIPGRVMLVIQPIGGADDWHALFHEAGHTEHYAHTSPGLKMEEKRLGDNAVTEGWAMLFEHLTDEPAWLRRKLDVPRPEEYAAEGMVQLLYVVRRYCAKLLYELEFHVAPSIDPPALAPRYVELLTDAVKIEPSPVDFLSDLDAGFYVSSYLRSWAFEAQIRSYLRGRFGNDWFTRREAGSLLRELWSEGQRQPAEDLLKDVTGATLEMEAVAERVRERVA